MENDILIMLQEAYSEPHRKYHTMRHIANMFLTATRNNILLTEEQTWAVWFHDVVYKLQPDEYMNNEVMSAGVAFEYLTNVVSRKQALIVGNIIQDTKDHIPKCEESKVVIDLDLWALSDSIEYKKNARLIQLEYESIMSKEDFLKGRLKWIEQMLGKKKYFWSEFATEEMDKKVRNNLKAEKEKIETWRLKE